MTFIPTAIILMLAFITVYGCIRETRHDREARKEGENG